MEDHRLDHHEFQASEKDLKALLDLNKQVFALVDFYLLQRALKLSFLLLKPQLCNEYFLLYLAKNVFSLHGVDRAGKAALVRPALRRDQLLKMVTKLLPCAIGIEACSGAHHWAREFAKFGHTVKPMIRIWVRTHRGTTRPFVDVQSPNSRLDKGEHPETEQRPGHVGKSL